MDLLSNIIRCEVDFARDFSNAVDRPWGVLFHNSEIPDSYDSNHACITDPAADLPTVIGEIVDFYRSRQLTPRAYHLGIDRNNTLRTALAAAGFTFYDRNSIFVVHRQASMIHPVDGIGIRRVRQLTPALCQMIERSDSVRERKVIERTLKHAGYHLLVGFVRGLPCSMASLQIVGGLTLVSSVLTDLPHRARGYSRAVIHYAVSYHSEHIGNTLYLYTDNPTAERIYRQAGFADLDRPLCSWSASLEQPAC